MEKSTVSELRILNTFIVSIYATGSNVINIIVDNREV